jgi:hypothetical protein
MNQIHFSHNWNGRLFLDHFSDVRIPDDDRFVVGNQLEVVLNRKVIGVVKIVAVREFRFKQITDVLSYLICGRNAAYLAEIIRRFYAQDHKLHAETVLVHLVFHYTSRDIPNQSTLLQEWWREKQDQHYQIANHS